MPQRSFRDIVETDDSEVLTRFNAGGAQAKHDTKSNHITKAVRCRRRLRHIQELMNRIISAAPGNRGWRCIARCQTRCHFAAKYPDSFAAAFAAMKSFRNRRQMRCVYDPVESDGPAPALYHFRHPCRRSQRPGPNNTATARQAGQYCINLCSESVVVPAAGDKIKPSTSRSSMVLTMRDCLSNSSSVVPRRTL